MINEARDVLIRSGLFRPDEFNGIQIRWCNLSGDTWGMTPDRNLICLSDRYFNAANHFGTAVTLAHEMIHSRQYRNRGSTDEFKCSYSGEYLHGGTGYGNAFEKEAYDFENQVARPLLTQMWLQAQQRR
jgi:hypothetical protein